MFFAEFSENTVGVIALDGPLVKTEQYENHVELKEKNIPYVEFIKICQNQYGKIKIIVLIKRRAN